MTTDSGDITIEEEGRMPLLEHLRELRDRLIRVVSATFICMIVCFFYYIEIWNFLIGPIIEALKDTGRGELAQLKLLEGIINQLKVAGLAGVFCASPYISYQIWQFVAPGLYKREKKLLIPLAFTSTLLFFAGASFGYFIIFDFVFPFLLKVSPENVKASISIDDALMTSTKLLIGFGMCFQLPVISFFLARMGMIDHKDMIKFFRYGIVGIFAVSALLTPPDPFSQVMMALPLTILYGVGIIVAFIFTTKERDDT